MRFSKRFISTTLVCVSLMMVFCFALYGCSAQNIPGMGLSGAQNAEDAQPNSREYMAQVNQTVAELTEKLKGFNDAVAREDLVGMQTQADNAFLIIDKLREIEAPEELTELKQGYIDGCTTLEDALNDYIDLYVQIASATDDHPFDYAAYASKIDSIQKAYNDGIAALENADNTATEL